eukprot:gnl/MRDRNA2_/MRDRNA2_102937_c0_seq1.p1 gnl/MRDRNA2_/MRDRNA2_102937_c0~~gnl/MRDRNA2_/MRDRNA2_102937_c0_seq1.p1  ORF type:complete len:296 (-),score=52.64 gnl/MRDRNA2_/MRDRNA2_102937_c0_seq1:135-1022(-)
MHKAIVPHPCTQDEVRDTEEAAIIEKSVMLVEEAIASSLGDKAWQSKITNFHCILEEKLYLGGKDVPAEDLQNVGITHIVRILEHEDDWIIPRNQLRGSLFVLAADHSNQDLRPHFSEVGDFIASALQSGGIVYIHCAQGRSRSCTLVLSYLVAGFGMSLCDAFAHVLSRRDVHAINLGFLSQLVDLDKKTHGVHSLPMLAAFLIKVRMNKDVAAEKSRKFDTSEIIALWQDEACQTRPPSMARVMVKTEMRHLKELVLQEKSLFIDKEPLSTDSCKQLRTWLDMMASRAQPQNN